jgi:hypothetical protein
MLFLVLKTAIFKNINSFFAKMDPNLFEQYMFETVIHRLRRFPLPKGKEAVLPYRYLYENPELRDRTIVVLGEMTISPRLIITLMDYVQFGEGFEEVPLEIVLRFSSFPNVSFKQRSTNRIDHEKISITVEKLIEELEAAKDYQTAIIQGHPKGLQASLFVYGGVLFKASEQAYKSAMRETARRINNPLSGPPFSLS